VTTISLTCRSLPSIPADDDAGCVHRPSHELTTGEAADIFLSFQSQIQIALILPHKVNKCTHFRDDGGEATEKDKPYQARP